MGIADHVAQLKRRFHGEIRVQLDEPLLGDALAGRISGTTDFDESRAVPAEVAFDALESFGADYLHVEPLWEMAAAAGTFITSFKGLETGQNIDGLGEHLSEGRRIGFAIAGEDARARRGGSVGIARLCPHKARSAPRAHTTTRCSASCSSRVHLREKRRRARLSRHRKCGSS